MHYSDEVNRLVQGVTEIEQDRDRFYTLQLSVSKNIAPFLSLGDARILYIKLANRLHDMRTIRSFRAVSQLRLAEETLWFLVPLSRTLGLSETGDELARLSAEVLRSAGCNAVSV